MPVTYDRNRFTTSKVNKLFQTRLLQMALEAGVESYDQLRVFLSMLDKESVRQEAERDVLRDERMESMPQDFLPSFITPQKTFRYRLGLRPSTAFCPGSSVISKASTAPAMIPQATIQLEKRASKRSREQEERVTVEEDEGPVALGGLPLLEEAADLQVEKGTRAVSAATVLSKEEGQEGSTDVPFPPKAALWCASQTHIHFVPVGQESEVPACKRKKGAAGRALFHKTQVAAGGASQWDVALSLGLAVCVKCAAAVQTKKA